MAEGEREQGGRESGGGAVTAEAGRVIRAQVIREPGVTTMTPRKREICWNYGVPPREAPYAVAEGLTITLRPGSITLVLGPSGSGKSSVLAAAAEKIGRVVWVGVPRESASRPVIDLVAPGKPLSTAMEILTACGLGEPRLWVRAFRDLSDGERFRASLARAIGRALDGSPQPVIFCDEFTAILHRRLARALAYTLRKLVTRHRLMFIAAATHEDIIPDLRPDEVISLRGKERSVGVVSAEGERQPVSLRERVVIEPGNVRDYHFFGSMHYRHRDGLGFVDKVFLMREKASRDPLGILVYAHAPMELAMRNVATGGRFIRNLRRVNRELRILRRLVMHPDVRGCGLGHWFVRRTLPKVGVRFVECLAAMGEVNPVFERAGMTRVGPCPLPRGRMELLQRLRAWKLDPFAPDFERKVARTPRVRELVIETVRKWLGAMHGPKREKVATWETGRLAQTFRQLIGRPPVYYLWDREGEFPKGEAGVMRAAPKGRMRRRSDDEELRTDREKGRHRPER